MYGTVLTRDLLPQLGRVRIHTDRTGVLVHFVYVGKEEGAFNFFKKS